jgi:hypothetical protein
MYWDPDEKVLYLLHSSLQLRLPILFDRHQLSIAIGVACPRHRRLLKARLGPLGRLIPDRRWDVVDGEERLVSVGGLWGRR